MRSLAKLDRLGSWSIHNGIANRDVPAKAMDLISHPYAGKLSDIRGVLGT